MEEANDKKIKVTPNGPYEVSGRIKLIKEASIADSEGTPEHWEKTGKFPDRELYRLCRCGRSGHKPDCDNTHRRIKFKGQETAARNNFRDRAERISGPDLDLDDDVSLCAQARFCHRAGGIWKLTRRSGDPAAKKTAIEEAANCPSGRLVMRKKKAKTDSEPDLTAAISVTEDPGAGVAGPLWVKGRIAVEAADGEVYERRNRVTLCRCGCSQNKPFCDGSHIAAGFKGN